MRFLRALLNSGVFMIILLAAATLYLVYSDAIKRDHGLDVVAESSSAKDVSEMPSASVAIQEPATPVASVVAVQSISTEEVPAAQTAPVVTQEPIQAEPAFETQPPAQAASEAVPVMLYQGMMPMPEQAPPMMPYQGMMPMAEPAMPPMMAYQAPMDMQPIQQQQNEVSLPPVYQQANALPQSNVDRARAALYEGNLEVAKQAYKLELLGVNDPDLHGELGNVYFAQQNWQDAAVEYAAAVEGLTAQGRFLQAQYVLGFLMQINPDMGQKATMNLREQMYPQANQ